MFGVQPAFVVAVKYYVTAKSLRQRARRKPLVAALQQVCSTECTTEVIAGRESDRMPMQSRCPGES